MIVSDNKISFRSVEFTEDDLKDFLHANGTEIIPFLRPSLMMEWALGIGEPIARPETTVEIKDIELEPQSKNTLYADSFPPTVKEKEFLAMFYQYAKHGVIKDWKYKVHVSGSQTGFGFVTFSDVRDAQVAMKNIDGKQMENQIIRVSPSNPPYHRTSSTNLYVEAIPKEWDAEYIQKLFSEHGTVQEVNLLLNRTTQEKTGVAFVHFETNEEAQGAIDALNGKVLEGAKTALVLRFARTTKASGGWKNRYLQGYKNRYVGPYANVGGYKPRNTCVKYLPY